MPALEAGRLVAPGVRGLLARVGLPATVSSLERGRDSVESAALYFLWVDPNNAAVLLLLLAAATLPAFERIDEGVVLPFVDAEDGGLVEGTVEPDEEKDDAVLKELPEPEDAVLKEDVALDVRDERSFDVDDDVESEEMGLFVPIPEEGVGGGRRDIVGVVEDGDEQMLVVVESDDQ